MIELIKPNNVRSQIILRSKYSQPTENCQENWQGVVDRAISHQKRIWTADVETLNDDQLGELEILRQGMLSKKIALAGRTLNLGGLPVASQQPETQFNCWYGELQTVHDIVDQFYLLLCGGGVTSVLKRGLSGFYQPVDLEIIRTQRTDKGGVEDNIESLNGDTWKITVGDTAESWAKFLGKLVAHLYQAKKLIVDFSELRPAGIPLSKFRWVSNGDEALADATRNLVDILNQNAGRQLSLIDIMDIITLFGGTLATRRSAQMMMVDYHDPELNDLITAKSDLIRLPHRQNSNNTIKCYEKPPLRFLDEILDFGLTNDAPAFMNVQAARNRYEGCEGLNPCGESIFPNCNLGEINLGKINSIGEANKLGCLLARALYRQTCPQFSNRILQKHWDRNLKTTRQVGVGLTNIVGSGLRSAQFREIGNHVIFGGMKMAHELGTPYPQATRVVKPSGTMTKILGGGGEGAHHPLAKYLLNNINFRIDDPILDVLSWAGYRIKNHPTKIDTVLVSFPISNNNPRYKFKDIGNGIYIDAESALDQLNRYLFLQRNWTDQNTSMTVLYRPDEIDGIVHWLDIHWDEYISVAFMRRFEDYAGGAKRFGYMPQQPINETTYSQYISSLKPIPSDKLFSKTLEIDDCGGACPVN